MKATLALLAAAVVIGLPSSVGLDQGARKIPGTTCVRAGGSDTQFSITLTPSAPAVDLWRVFCTQNGLAEGFR